MDDFWVFGYGSLMWNPGFAYEDTMTARAFGYRRSLCVRSFVHRGTPERPGLVLGLDRGGSCRGMAFRVAAKDHAEVTEYLRERELVTHVYKERTMPVLLANGRRVPALTYVIDRTHLQYAGALSAEEAAATVAVSHGKSGANTEYVVNTLAHLREMGIRDHWLEEVVATMERLAIGRDERFGSLGDRGGSPPSVGVADISPTRGEIAISLHIRKGKE